MSRMLLSGKSNFQLHAIEVPGSEAGSSVRGTCTGGVEDIRAECSRSGHRSGYAAVPVVLMHAHRWERRESRRRLVHWSIRTAVLQTAWRRAVVD